MQIMKLLITQFFPLPVTCFLVDPNIFLNNPLSKVLSLCPSFNMTDQVSHQSKTTDKITVLHVLIFSFLDCKQKHNARSRHSLHLTF
jgi:hypothetical protein